MTILEAHIMEHMSLQAREEVEQVPTKMDGAITYGNMGLVIRNKRAKNDLRDEKRAGFIYTGKEVDDSPLMSIVSPFTKLRVYVKQPVVKKGGYSITMENPILKDIKLLPMRMRVRAVCNARHFVRDTRIPYIQLSLHLEAHPICTVA